MILISATSDFINQRDLPCPTFFIALTVLCTINTEIIVRKIGGRKIKAAQPCGEVPRGGSSTEDDMKAGVSLERV